MTVPVVPNLIINLLPAFLKFQKFSDALQGCIEFYDDTDTNIYSRGYIEVIFDIVKRLIIKYQK